MFLYLGNGKTTLVSFEEENCVKYSLETFCNDRIVRIATGGHHFCVATRSGKMYSWGTRNNKCQFGVPDPVNSDAPTPIAIDSESVISVYATYNCSFALSKSGKLYASGDNRVGQCGVSIMKASLFPKMTAVANSHVLGKIELFANSRKMIGQEWNTHFAYLPRECQYQTKSFLLSVSRLQRKWAISLPKPILRLILWNLLTSNGWWKIPTAKDSKWWKKK